MAVWFSPNAGLNFRTLGLFSDNPRLGFEGRYSGRFLFLEGWKLGIFVVNGTPGF